MPRDYGQYVSSGTGRDCTSDSEGQDDFFEASTSVNPRRPSTQLGKNESQPRWTHGDSQSQPQRQDGHPKASIQLDSPKKLDRTMPASETTQDQCEKSTSRHSSAESVVTNPFETPGTGIASSSNPKPHAENGVRAPVAGLSQEPLATPSLMTNSVPAHSSQNHLTERTSKIHGQWKRFLTDADNSQKKNRPSTGSVESIHAGPAKAKSVNSTQLEITTDHKWKEPINLRSRSPQETVEKWQGQFDEMIAELKMRREENEHTNTLAAAKLKTAEEEIAMLRDEITRLRQKTDALEQTVTAEQRILGNRLDRLEEQYTKLNTGSEAAIAVQQSRFVAGFEKALSLSKEIEKQAALSNNTHQANNNRLNWQEYSNSGGYVDGRILGKGKGKDTAAGIARLRETVRKIKQTRAEEMKASTPGEAKLNKWQTHCEETNQGTDFLPGDGRGSQPAVNGAEPEACSEYSDIEEDNESN